ncbi:MAG: NAD-dependent epimerase/dehydratase family protein [Pseudomonadota bacterium]
MTGRLVAISGATGFVGRHVVRGLVERGYRVRALVRREADLPAGATSAVIGDLRRPAMLGEALAGVEAIVHSAGLAHQPAGVDEAEMLAINADATETLARAGERARVRRFVFLSSVRAQSGPSAARTLTEEMAPAPIDAYGRSKLRAEAALMRLDIDWAALRPVLVYGAGARGNLESLLALARRSVPLPFGAARAPRSLLAVDGLVEAVATLLEAPGPLRRPFLVADERPLGLADMLRALRRGLGRSPGLLPVPPVLLAPALRLLGRGDMAARLFEPLVVDTSALRSLGWRPVTDTARRLEAWAAATRVEGGTP